MIETLEKKTIPFGLRGRVRLVHLSSSNFWDLRRSYITRLVSRSLLVNDLEEHFNCINYGDRWMAGTWRRREAVKSVIDFRTSVLNPNLMRRAMCQSLYFSHSRLENILIHLFSPSLTFFWGTSEKKHVKWLLFLCFSTHLSSHLWLLNDIVAVIII